jgi:hypothetical protein
MIYDDIGNGPHKQGREAKRENFHAKRLARENQTQKNQKRCESIKEIENFFNFGKCVTAESI